jgi:hypothetical protein
MGQPGTYRQGDRTPVEFADALAEWTAAAIPILERVARTYHGTITYQELGEQVQEATGIRTRMLLRYWIGRVLGGVARTSHGRGHPILSALCVRGNGTVGAGYAEAVAENYGEAPDDIEMHAAVERLRCYRHFGAVLPPGGGEPALTPQVAVLRARATGRARDAASGPAPCPTCNLVLPVTGKCDTCL